MNKQTNIKNKTPHNVKIMSKRGNVIKTFPRSQSPIRLESETKRVGVMEEIPLSRTTMEGGNLPPEKEGQYYIVSRAVQSAYPDRTDLLIPNETVRDDKGRIVGCQSLAVPENFSSSSSITKEEFLVEKAREKAFSLVEDKEPAGTLSEIADSHGAVVSAEQMVEKGIKPSSTVFLVSSAKKRKLYAIVEKNDLIFAYGTFFGNQSSFDIEGGLRNLTSEIIGDNYSDVDGVLSKKEKTELFFEYENRK